MNILTNTDEEESTVIRYDYLDVINKTEIKKD